jgi:hypothetical protein
VYDFHKGERVVFSKYTIDDIDYSIENKKTGERRTYKKDGEGYNSVNVYDDNGSVRGIRVSRAVLSTFVGPPPTDEHTADHVESEEKDNDSLSNLRWATLSEQSANQSKAETYKSAYIIVKDGLEKTAKEWAEYLKNEKSVYGKEYTNIIILDYAMKKRHGFAYKVFPDLPDEIWKTVPDSKTKKGYWEISDQKRVKYITKYASNVLSGDQLKKRERYPAISFNKKDVGCHVLAFMVFYPDLWAARKPGEMVLHKYDDRDDFRPHMLRLGTLPENMKDAHDNNKYAGKKSERARCASYIGGEIEKIHDSQEDAVKYLKKNGYDKAYSSNIRAAIRAFNESGKVLTKYGRTWRTAPINT